MRYLPPIKNHNSKKKRKPIHPLPQIIHRKDEPKTHHLQNSTKVSTKTNPFTSRYSPVQYYTKKPRAAVVILLSSIQSIHLYCRRPDQLQFLTHISKASNPSDKSQNTIRWFLRSTIYSSAINDNTHVSAQRSPLATHPRKPFIAGLSTLPLFLLLP